LTSCLALLAMASSPTRRSSDLHEPVTAEKPVAEPSLHEAVGEEAGGGAGRERNGGLAQAGVEPHADRRRGADREGRDTGLRQTRSEEHTSELQSPYDLVCRLLL